MRGPPEVSPCSAFSASSSTSTSWSSSASSARSSVSVMRRPLLRKAICWNRLRSVSKSYTVESKISPSAQKVMVVPVSSVSSPFSSGASGTPRE